MVFLLMQMNVYAANDGIAVKSVAKANALPVSVKKAMETTRDYILKVDTNPDLSSQWNVIGLARSGLDEIPQSYYDTFYKNAVTELKEKNGVLTQNKFTEYSKLILSMTAIGKDASDIAGYNLLSYLADFENVTTQGFNGPIWALIALNSNPDYEIPTVKGVETQTTRQVLIDYILDGEVDGGGWNLVGETADVDMTGMAIQALAPYYGKTSYEDVTEAVDRALTWLSTQQNPATGGYATSETENSESTDQVIVALCALKLNPKTDDRFIKSGYWTVEALLQYYVKGGGFMHVQPESDSDIAVNGMATEQAFYALVAYNRFQNGKTALYDMSDVSIKKGEDIKNSSTKDKTAETTKASTKDKTAGTTKASVKDKTAETTKASVKDKIAETTEASAKDKTAETTKASVKDKTAETTKASAKDKTAETTKASKKSSGKSNRSSSSTQGSSRQTGSGTSYNGSSRQNGTQASTGQSNVATQSSSAQEDGTESSSEQAQTQEGGTEQSTEAAQTEASTEWSFSGETYIPNTTNRSDNTTQTTQVTESKDAYSVLLLVETFLLGIVVGVVAVLGVFFLRKKKLSKKKLSEKKLEEVQENE
jgi:hypothetical protein